MAFGKKLSYYLVTAMQVNSNILKQKIQKNQELQEDINQIVVHTITNYVDMAQDNTLQVIDSAKKSVKGTFEDLKDGTVVENVKNSAKETLEDVRAVGSVIGNARTIHNELKQKDEALIQAKAKHAKEIEEVAEIVEKLSKSMTIHIENEKKCLQLFSIAIAASNADGNIDDEEKACMFELVQGLSYMSQDLESALLKELDNPKTVKDSILNIKQSEFGNDDEFIEKISLLVEEIIKADGVITESEQEFVREFKLAFNKSLAV